MKLHYKKSVVRSEAKGNHPTSPGVGGFGQGIEKRKRSIYANPLPPRLASIFLNLSSSFLCSIVNKKGQFQYSQLLTFLITQREASKRHSTIAMKP